MPTCDAAACASYAARCITFRDMSNHVLKDLRKALDMTQAEFAAAIGVQQSYISLIENDPNRRLGGETALAIADRFRERMNQLGITVEDLLRGTRGRRPQRRGMEATA